MGLISIFPTPVLCNYFCNHSIFMNFKKAISRLKLVFKTWSTQEYLCYLIWEFLLYGVWETSYSPAVSSAKYFQGFKILKYLQNTVCMSFDHLFSTFTSTYFRIQGKHQICSKRAPWYSNTSWHDSPKLSRI